jgi:phosphatidylglycerophosphate synthase
LAVPDRDRGPDAPSSGPSGADGGGKAPKPWDARLAALLVRPRVGTRVQPNHLTTLSLLSGLTAAALYGTADRQAANWGAALYVLTNLLDHADGELARLAGTTSVAGGFFDRVTDLVVRASVIMGIGLGLRSGPLGHWTIVLGVTAAATFVVLFALRSELARRGVEGALDQPSGGGFDLNDVLYLIAPLTWLGLLEPFLAAAGIGAPAFCLWTARHR